MELEALQEVNSEVTNMGARIVVLTPELERYTRSLHKQGIIRAADVNADYTIRPEPSETVEHLRTLTK
jgi:hypothetical protein